MKRSYLKRKTGLQAKKRTLRVRHPSDTNVLKDQIQDLLRKIVIERDGGCILRPENWLNVVLVGPQPCNGYTKAGQLVLQADHLITRGNSATYADHRLVVCVCKGHHKWKEYNKERYDQIVRSLLPKERVKLWDAAHEARYRPHRTGAHDWKLAITELTQVYKHLILANKK